MNPTFKQFDCEMFRVAIQQMVDKKAISAGIGVPISVYVDDMADRIILALTTQGPSRKTRSEKRYTTSSQVLSWPLDWWQAFRDRWFPSWWLRRWPVRMNTATVTIQENVQVTEIVHMCPHIRVPDNQRHFQFLMMDQGE